MVLCDARLYFLIPLLIVVAPISAQHKDAEWFGDNEASTPSTTTRFGNRRAVNRTSTLRYFPRTTRYEEGTPSTTNPFGNGRTVSRTSTPRYIPRTTKYSLPPTVEVSNRSTRVPLPTFSPIKNLTDVIADLVKNFAEYTTSNRPSTGEDGNKYFAGVLKLEILTMATDNHFFVPPTEDKNLEEKQLESAGSAVQLWLDLFCTEDVDAIFDKVVRETVIQYKSTRELLAVKKMHEILHTLFNKLNNTIEENDFLSTMYKAERIRYLVRHFHDADTQQKVYFPLDDVARGADVDWELLGAWVNDLDIRKFLIHGAVLNMRKDESGRRGSYEDDQNSVWIRTVLKLAKEECCMSKMQNVYTAALNVTATNFDAAASPWGTIRSFIDTLNKSIEADSVLKKEWMKQKNDVREKLRKARSNNN